MDHLVFETSTFLSTTPKFNIYQLSIILNLTPSSPNFLFIKAFGKSSKSLHTFIEPMTTPYWAIFLLNDILAIFERKRAEMNEKQDF